MLDMLISVGTMDFGERLRAVREGRLARVGPAISLRELARRSGVSNSTLSQWENGRTWGGRIPPYDVVRRVAEALGVSPESLTGGDAAPDAPRYAAQLDYSPEQVAEIVRYIETRPLDPSVERLLSLKPEMKPDDYARLCVRVFRAQGANLDNLVGVAEDRS